MKFSSNIHNEPSKSASSEDTSLYKEDKNMLKKEQIKQKEKQAQ